MVNNINISVAERPQQTAEIAARPRYTYKQIAPALHKWAKFFCNNRFKYWELINAVWEKSRFQDCKHINLISGRVKWDMIEYMREQTNFRNNQRHEKEGKFVPKAISLNTPIGLEDGELGELLEAPHQENHTKDYFDWLTRGMEKRHALVIKLRFIEDFSLKSIGRVLGLKESRISQILTRLLPVLKAKLCHSNPDLADRKYRKGKPGRNKIDQAGYWRVYYQANKERILAGRRIKRLRGVA